MDDLEQMNMEVAFAGLEEALDKLSENMQELRQWYEEYREVIHE